eukprot:4698731-Alexandrium_andersonii.AAC.1
MRELTGEARRTHNALIHDTTPLQHNTCISEFAFNPQRRSNPQCAKSADSPNPHTRPIREDWNH